MKKVCKMKNSKSDSAMKILFDPYTITIMEKYTDGDR